jgi:hypothetical protein
VGAGLKMPRQPSSLRDFIYANLPYLLLIGLALPLLLTEREIGLDLASRISVRERPGLLLGLATQRLLALLILLFAAWKILARPRR